MKSIQSQSRINFSLLGWTLAVLALTFGFPALATQSSYQNYSDHSYSIPGTPPPTIDATNFANYNQFNVTFDNPGGNAQFYEPMNAVNYTNDSSGIDTGIMTVNSPPITNTLFGFFNFAFSYNSVGVGFQFDTQTTNTITHKMAGTFYNSGDIRADSVIDGNNLLSGAFSQFNVGQCLVWATNIVCPGSIDTSENGFIDLTGNNLDLTRAALTEEQELIQGFSATNLGVSVSSEAAGFNTNGWDPFFDLTATNAIASFPDNLYLSFPTSYFAGIQEGPSNVLVRAVFIVNANSNVPANVYIAPASFENEGALLQWSGTYIDPLTGVTDTNYLNLFHYFPGSFGVTNIFPILTVGSLPQPGTIGFFNYLESQNTPLPNLGAPNAAGFQNVFNDNFFTNFYEYFNSSLAVTTVGTNASTGNPSGALTNLPGRIQITANNDLKLANAYISGGNYLALTATNQFDGNDGAVIASPYSDINLGVTNGYPHPLTVSNLLVANIPGWAGTLNEWSTRWTNTDANGISWDYRVMLVYANLSTTLNPQVQNLTLTASNLVISDTLNVFGSMSANAQSLTLTTNTYGSGATSPDGELNMQLENPFTWSWTNSFPNLRYLTNDGAIRMPNFSDFIATSSVTNITTNVPSIQAAAILSETGPSNNIAAGGTVTIGNTPYNFVAAVNNSVPYQVKVGANFNGSMSNLIAAINQGPGSGTAYSSETFASSVATAGTLSVSNHNVIISANANNYPGTTGNNIPVSTTVTNLAWNSTVLTGGLAGTPGSTNITAVPSPYGAIINNGYLTDQGSTIWVTNFLSGGVISNGPGSFQLTSLTTELTNGSIIAGGDISLTADTLVTSNVMMQAGRSLVLQVTNLFSDGGVSNGNVWAVGATNGTGGPGLILASLPNNTATNTTLTNNLLGTTISLVTPPPNKEVSSIWAGQDYGASPLGYTNNNMAIGQLVLTALSPASALYFSGPPTSTTSNAIYVDRLILENYASLADREGSAGIPTLLFNNNLTIYYADAVSSQTVNGGPLQDVSSILNGLNGGHLVWVPQYIGYFSGTNVAYPDGSVVDLNIGVFTGGDNTRLSSNGTGIPNSSQSAPVFVGSQIDFQEFRAGNSNELTWHSPPGSTNFVMYCTTNWANWNIAAIVTNSPVVPPPAGWPVTNVVYQPTNANSASFKIKIDQDNSILYGH
jgi:hypothetical protein